MKKKALPLTILLLSPLLMGVKIKEPIMKEYHDISTTIISSTPPEVSKSGYYEYEMEFKNTGDKYTICDNLVIHHGEKNIYYDASYFKETPLFYNIVLGKGQSFVKYLRLSTALPNDITVSTYAYNEENYVKEGFEITNPHVEINEHAYLLAYDSITLPGEANFILLVDATYDDAPVSFYVNWYSYDRNHKLYLEASSQTFDHTKIEIKNVTCLLNSMEYIPADQKARVEQINAILIPIFLSLMVIAIAAPLLIYYFVNKKKTQAK